MAEKSPYEEALAVLSDDLGRTVTSARVVRWGDYTTCGRCLVAILKKEGYFQVTSGFSSYHLCLDRAACRRRVEEAEARVVAAVKGAGNETSPARLQA